MWRIIFGLQARKTLAHLKCNCMHFMLLRRNFAGWRFLRLLQVIFLNLFFTKKQITLLIVNLCEPRVMIIV